MFSKIKILFSLFIFVNVFSTNNFAQNQSVAEITFDKLVHNYGIIYQNDDGATEFYFTNTGTEPLIITDVKSNCGCTVPKWTKEPVLPGERGSVKVVYDTRRIGTINKQVSVYSNATNQITHLSIKGEIQKKPSAMMPIKAINNSATPVAR